MMLEALRGIRAIKAHAWEPLFARKARALRVAGPRCSVPPGCSAFAGRLPLPQPPLLPLPTAAPANARSALPPGVLHPQVRAERRAELAALAVRKYLDALCVYFW